MPTPSPSTGPDTAPQGPPDPLTLLRSRGYLMILVVAALIGIPVALIAFGFLQLSAHLQGWIFVDLPRALGMGAPLWWPIPVLVAGVGPVGTVGVSGLPQADDHAFVVEQLGRFLEAQAPPV